MLPDFITNPDPSIYESDNYIVLDFETYGEDYGTAIHENNGPILASWRLGPGHPAYFRAGHGSVRSSSAALGYTELLELTAQSDFIVGHHIKYDLQWLRRAGTLLEEQVVFCTQLGQYVHGGNLPGPMSLDALDKKLGGQGKSPLVDLLIKHGEDTRDIPIHLLQERCEKDVEQTENLFLYQRRLLKESGKLGVFLTRCLTTPVLADVEFNGLHLDGERVVSAYNEYARRLESLRREIDEFSGGINFRSTKQTAEFIYGPKPDGLGFSELKDRGGNPIRTAGDKPKTDVKTLEILKASNKRQRQFIDLRKRFGKVNAALTKSLNFFYGTVIENGGTFYGQFNQAVTRTHRLSSSGRPVAFDVFDGDSKSAQLQNLANEFKPLFAPRRPGWKLLEVDGSQLEFRVAAHLGRDGVATDAIRNGFDVHTFTADVLTAAGEETTRKGAKPHTFKPLYGGRSGTPAQQKYYEAFRERYPGITGAQGQWIDTVLVHGELTIPSGLTFYYPGTKMTGSGWVTNTPSICNYPVQSYATADIIPIALFKIWHELKARGLEGYIINTVHDSILIECPEHEIDEIREICFEALTTYVYFYLDKVYDDQFTVPLGAEAVAGDHWTEGDEVSISVEPPFENAA